MIENRELTMDDYLAMLSRRAKVILIPALLAPLVGFGISWMVPAKYTSQSLILVEGQKVPENMVQPVVSEDLTARMVTLQQQVLSQPSLQAMLERLQLVKPGQNASDMMEDIRANTSMSQVPVDATQIAAKRRPGQGSAVPGFNVNYTASNPREAQAICSDLTAQIVDLNRQSVAAVASGTRDVLSKGLEDAKHNLDDLDGKLASFKKQYVGQLPGDEENNLKILMGLNSQLESNTQTLNRAQQDKAYTESILAQQLAAWRSTQSASNPQTLEKQLSDLQSELLGLQARYTSDHPDVIKVKADIAEVKKKLAEVNAAAALNSDAPTDKSSASEPAEIRQLRLQIHQYSDLIMTGTRDQKRLTEQIALYQGRVSLSPTVEEQYKALARDYENAQKNYQELLGNKSKADMTRKMTDQQQGESMRELNPASLPDAPSFPVRLYFLAGGLGAGLAVGAGIALWLELRDKSIRTEADAEAALDLPMLVAIPWVSETAEPGNGYGDTVRRLWKKKPDDRKETVGV